MTITVETIQANDKAVAIFEGDDINELFSLQARAEKTYGMKVTDGDIADKWLEVEYNPTIWSPRAIKALI